MAFKEEGIGFNNRSHFTNEMARFVGTEASMFSKGEDTAVGKVDDMAEKALNDGCTATNPRPVTKEQIKHIYTKLW